MAGLIFVMRIHTLSASPMAVLGSQRHVRCLHLSVRQ
jgi:hypothetical protein